LEGDLVTFTVRKLKTITFSLDGTEYSCQVQSWELDPGIDDGDVLYSYCSDGTGRQIQEVDENPTLAVTFYSDYAVDGISDFLWAHKGETVPFELDHLPDIPTEHVQFGGTLVLRPGPVGGEVRDNDMTETNFQVVTLNYVRGV
jgi:hypothetical protein